MKKMMSAIAVTALLMGGCISKPQGKRNWFHVVTVNGVKAYQRLSTVEATIDSSELTVTEKIDSPKALVVSTVQYDCAKGTKQVLDYAGYDKATKKMVTKSKSLKKKVVKSKAETGMLTNACRVAVLKLYKYNKLSATQKQKINENFGKYVKQVQHRLPQ